MELKVNVEKKKFTTQDGEIKTYYSITAEVGGEVIRLKADDKDKKLLTHLLDKMDIPVVADNEKEILINKLLTEGTLTDEEKAKLKSYIGEGED